MKTIYLLRHAKSSWDDEGLEDFDRPLAPRGRRAMAKVGPWFAGVGPAPEVVLVSAARRTIETFEALRGHFAHRFDLHIERDLYHAPSGVLRERLKALPGTAGAALLIGHNPGLGDLAVSLVAEGGMGEAGEGDAGDFSRMREKFPTAAVAVLRFPGVEWGRLSPGSCQLRSFIAPRDFG